MNSIDALRGFLLIWVLLFLNFGDKNNMPELFECKKKKQETRTKYKHE